jgi:hypothetical protein
VNLHFVGAIYEVIEEWAWLWGSLLTVIMWGSAAWSVNSFGCRDWVSRQLRRFK